MIRKKYFDTSGINLFATSLSKTIEKNIAEMTEFMRSQQRGRNWYYSSTTTNRPQTSCVRTVLSAGLLTPIPLIYKDIYNKEQLTGLRVGHKYALQEEPCEGTEMPISVYECKHIIKEFGGINLNSVVMKQLEGNSDMIFSLTKADCKNFGLKYEPQLQLFPINFNWKRLDTIIDIKFDPRNMGTYKPSPLDGTIHQMHILINGIDRAPSIKLGMREEIPHIILPNGRVHNFDFFLNTLIFKFKDKNLQRHFPITYKVLSDKNNGNIIDSRNKTIGIMLFFGATEGIDPQEFEGKTIDELIEASWEENVLNSQVSSNMMNNHFDECFGNW